jgi:hypothetical protein
MPTTPGLQAGGRGELILGFVLLVALHLALAMPMRAPIIFGDETANLGIARFLASRPPYPLLAHPVQGWVPYYRFGYPLLLAPAWRLTSDPLTVYRAALVLNGFLLASLFPLLAAFARRTLALPRREAALTAFAASLYPSFLLQSNLTWSESLLIPAVSCVVVAFQRLAENPGLGTACVFSLLTVSAYAVHERVLGLVPLALLVLVLLWRWGRLSGRAGLAAATVAIAAFAVIRAVDSHIFARLWAGSSRRPGIGDIAAGLAAPEGLGNALLSLTGQLWYLTVASSLLFPLGLWVLVRTARRAEAPAQRLTARFILAAAGVLLATSSLFITWFPRADLAIYGRYVEAFLGLFLVAGLAGFHSVVRRHRLVALAMVFLPGLLAAILLAGHDASVFRRVYNEMTISGIMPTVLLLGGLRMLRISAVGAAAGAGVLVAGLVRPRAAAVLSAALFFAGALWVHQRWLVPVQQAGFEARSLPVAVQALGVREVAYDLAAATHDEFFAYQFRLGDARFVFFDERLSPPPRDLVISNKLFGRRHPEARLVFPDKVIDQALWVMPGNLQDRLQRAGWLFPIDSGAPLPHAADCSRLAWTRAPEKPVLDLRPGGARWSVVRLTHCGTEAPWLPMSTREDPTGAVRLGIRWLRDGTVVAEHRAELPHVLAPGMTVEMNIPIAARTPEGTPLPPGRYEVRIGLVQELVRWFPEDGDRSIRIEVEVE